MPAVAAPKPIQPSPVEVQSWQAQGANARQQYLAQQAQGQYGRTQATLTHGTQQRQLAYNQQQGRQTFDDPYIGRGIFNSGIRGAGLTNFYTNAANEQSNAQQQYLAQMGQYNLNDTLAGSQYTTSMNNIYGQEAARKAQLQADLAAAIKGIA